MCDKALDRKAGAKYCSECVKLTTGSFYHPKAQRRVNHPKMDWQGGSYLGLTPSTTDWAQLASFLDGEGCIRLGLRGKTKTQKSICFYAYAVVTNTDPRLPAWCSEKFGMKVYGKSTRWAGDKKAANWKGCFFAQASSFRACWILKNCLPWFVLKRAQAEVVLEHQQTTVAGVYDRVPGGRTPQDILEYRISLKQKIAELNKKGPREIEITLEKEA